MCSTLLKKTKYIYSHTIFKRNDFVPIQFWMRMNRISDTVHKRKP